MPLPSPSLLSVSFCLVSFVSTADELFFWCHWCSIRKKQNNKNSQISLSFCLEKKKLGNNANLILHQLLHPGEEARSAHCFDQESEVSFW